MKRFLSVLLVVLMSVALSLSAPTSEALAYSLKKQNNVQTIRREGGLIGAVLCDCGGITITVQEAEIREVLGHLKLFLSVVVENNTNVLHRIYNYDASLNDWVVDPICAFDVKAGKKLADDIVIYLDGTDVVSLDDIDSMSFSFSIATQGKRNVVSDEVTIELN